MSLGESVAMIVFDVETTGHGIHQSDVIQLSAVANTFPIKSNFDMTCNLFFRSDQEINWFMSQKTGFSELFNETRLRTSPTFAESIHFFFQFITQVSIKFQRDRVWLAGHKIFSSDLLVLHAHCKREGINLAQQLEQVTVEACLDTLRLAQQIWPAVKEKGLEPLYERISNKKIGETTWDTPWQDADSKEVCIFSWHDARGDVMANQALLEHEDFKSCLVSGAQSGIHRRASLSVRGKTRRQSDWSQPLTSA